MNIREPLLALSFDAAITKRLLIWDKDIRTSERNRLAAAIWGADEPDEQPMNEEAMLSAIPTFSGGVNKC